LLLLSALDSGRIELHVQPVPLRATVQEVLEDLALAAQERCVALANEVPAGAGGARRRGPVAAGAFQSHRQCHQVWPRAGPRAGRRPTALGAGWVQVFVRDDGPGIPAEARERVFERFFRVDKARARSQGGTGLGLAIVKNLVLAHGGEVRLESADGRGTTFYFKLPAA
jgi:signal transduction histidine kinase